MIPRDDEGPRRITGEALVLWVLSRNR